jgi:hypothetical protein
MRWWKFIVRSRHRWSSRIVNDLIWRNMWRTESKRATNIRFESRIQGKNFKTEQNRQSAALISDFRTRRTEVEIHTRISYPFIELVGQKKSLHGQSIRCFLCVLCDRAGANKAIATCSCADALISCHSNVGEMQQISILYINRLYHVTLRHVTHYVHLA